MEIKSIDTVLIETITTNDGTFRRTGFKCWQWFNGSDWIGIFFPKRLEELETAYNNFKTKRN